MARFVVNWVSALIAQSCIFQVLVAANPMGQDSSDIRGGMSEVEEHRKLGIQLFDRAWEVLPFVAHLDGTSLGKPSRLTIPSKADTHFFFPIQASAGSTVASAKRSVHPDQMHQQVEIAPVTSSAFQRNHGSLTSPVITNHQQTPAMPFKSDGFARKPAPLDPFAIPKHRNIPAPVKSIGAMHNDLGRSTLLSINEARSNLRCFDLLKQKAIRPTSTATQAQARCASSELRASCESLAAHSTRVLMGILAPDARRGIAALKDWTSDLKLPKGKLYGMDVDGKPVDLPDGSVYIKYNSDSGNAHISSYRGGFRGVLFSPELVDGSFHQFGYLPLEMPTHTFGNDHA